MAQLVLLYFILQHQLTDKPRNIYSKDIWGFYRYMLFYNSVVLKKLNELPADSEISIAHGDPHP